MTHSIAVDLETTSANPLTAEIVQCAILPIALPSWGVGVCWDVLARPHSPIPLGASAVHGIYDADVAEQPHITEHSDEIARRFDGADLVITYNGAAFDLPIIERVLGIKPSCPHFDVFRAWQVARAGNLIPPRPIESSEDPHASRFTGALGSAHAWLTGREPTGAHKADVDCRMTAEVGEALASHYGLSQCLEWGVGPLPGMLDIAGKIDDETRLTFSKHKGKKLTTLARTERGFLRWMLSADFHEDTKKIVRRALAGTL